MAHPVTVSFDASTIKCLYVTIISWWYGAVNLYVICIAWLIYSIVFHYLTDVKGACRCCRGPRMDPCLFSALRNKTWEKAKRAFCCTSYVLCLHWPHRLFSSPSSTSICGPTQSTSWLKFNTNAAYFHVLLCFAKSTQLATPHPTHLQLTVSGAGLQVSKQLAVAKIPFCFSATIKPLGSVEFIL